MEMNIGKLKEIISKRRVGMLGTYSGKELNFRPMSHVDVDDTGKIWFFTSLTSLKADELERNSSVILTYANESDNSYLSLNGMAFLNTDRTKMKELFNPFIKAWFPDGLNDPKICLLVVQPDEFEYWSTNENKVITSIKMLWAAMTSTQPPIGEHKSYTL
jgi:general stress protein 26